MKKDMIFFGENGLTMTSANYIANLSKEYYMQIEMELDNVRFYSKSMSLIGSAVSQIISEGTDDVSKIQSKLDKVARLKSLIAWIREAVKAKSSLLDEVDNMGFVDFGIEVPETPDKPVYLTEDDIVSKWNIKQRNRYYYLETLCAQIGKYIHPSGVLSKERKAMYDSIHNPNYVSGDGRDAIVYSVKPSIDPVHIEDLFMELQNRHRECQAELNSMKHEIETLLENDKKDKDFEYNRQWNEYSNVMSELHSKLKVLKNEKVSEIQKLKIVIPDSLKPIYEEVSSLGKKQS